jgi:hypothetical protein
MVATPRVIPGISGSEPVLANLLESNLLCSPFPEVAVTSNVGYDPVTTKSAQSRPEVKQFVDWIISKTPCVRIVVGWVAPGDSVLVHKPWEFRNRAESDFY